MSKIPKENNNTDLVCILVWHFILLAIKYSMAFRRIRYRTCIQNKITLIHKIVSGPPPSVFLLLWHSYWTASSGVILQ